MADEAGDTGLDIFGLPMAVVAVNEELDFESWGSRCAQGVRLDKLALPEDIMDWGDGREELDG